MAQAFGIDIGGSGIKGAYVDLESGTLVQKRKRIPTPSPATPREVGKVCAKILEHFEVPENMPVGVAFPAPLPGGIIPFMANLDQSWVGKNLEKVTEKYCGRRVTGINDADAAGYAEAVYGAAKDKPGVVVITTLGTGIGTTLIYNGTLVPNTELGHIEIDGYDAESRAASSAKTREELNWVEWSKRLQRYYSELEKLFSPDLFVVGGGVSRDHENYLPLLNLRTPIIPAILRNHAGIIGAAKIASENQV